MVERHFIGSDKANLRFSRERDWDEETASELASQSQSLTLDRKILVLGQQCIIRNGELILGARYERLLDHVYAVWSYYRAPVVIPAAWLGKGPVMYGVLAKHYLMEVHGMRFGDVIIYGDASAPSGLQPARTTYEELQALQVLGPHVIVVCESAQAPRSSLMAQALGYTPVFKPLQVTLQGFPWLYEVLLSALAWQDPHERLLNWFGIIRWRRGKRKPYGDEMPPQPLRF